MKTMILAAAAILSIGMGSGSAFAASEGGTHANTFFTELPGVMAHAPVQTMPNSAVAANQNGAATGAYVTRSASGTWLFPGNASAASGGNGD
jgi:hypothetical protein